MADPKTRPPVSGNQTPLVELRSLVVSFPLPGVRFGRSRRRFNAVDKVSFRIGRGESLGLVGESGCGKSTLARAVLRLLPADSGQVIFDGLSVADLERGQIRRLRRRSQMVFQDASGSLNPRMRVGTIIGEPLHIHRLARGWRLRERVQALMEQVGLNPADIDRYPHEFSGGQRQRVGIARAIASGPEFIVCDEPVSALDVSVRGQVLNLLVDLKDELGLSYLFIAHDLAVVRHISDRVAVMYFGQIVELGPADTVLSTPAHPYTRALMAAVPHSRSSRWDRGAIVRGEVPSPGNPPAGCPFAPRCPLATDLCHEREPTLEFTDDTRASHQAACHHADQVS
jgi:oligopeptide/dipeptide ABC transporter ATP-binding protein